eukprot:Skav216708  [mRNA]  locus=scaffold91:585039:585848:+ [translate_table: standard]
MEAPAPLATLNALPQRLISGLSHSSSERSPLVQRTSVSPWTLPVVSVVALAARTKTKKSRATKKRPGLGFSMKKVSDEPLTDYDSGPKLFEILKYPHPSLRRPNEEVTEFGPKLKQLSENLFRTMYAKDNGCGLAAPQCGINLRVLVYNHLRELESTDREGETVYVNPRIVASSEDQDEEVEGCLSFPGFGAPVVRPTWVEVEAVDLEGKAYTKRLEGEQARIFQHEYDHLDGVVYIDHVDSADKEKIESELNKLISDYSAAGGKDPRP